MPKSMAKVRTEANRRHQLACLLAPSIQARSEAAERAFDDAVVALIVAIGDPVIAAGIIDRASAAVKAIARDAAPPQQATRGRPRGSRAYDTAALRQVIHFADRASPAAWKRFGCNRDTALAKRIASSPELQRHIFRSEARRANPNGTVRGYITAIKRERHAMAVDEANVGADRASALARLLTAAQKIEA
jgi:hypothetical protein